MLLQLLGLTAGGPRRVFLHGSMPNISDAVVDGRHIIAALLLILLLALVQICHLLLLLVWLLSVKVVRCTFTMWVQNLLWSENRILGTPKGCRHTALVLFVTMSVEIPTIWLSLLAPVVQTLIDIHPWSKFKLQINNRG